LQMKKRILDILLGGSMFFLWVCSMTFAFASLQSRGIAGDTGSLLIYAALTVIPVFLYRFLAGKFRLNRPASVQCPGCGAAYDGQLDACPHCGQSPSKSQSRWRRADSIGLVIFIALVAGGIMHVRDAVVGSENCWSQKQALINLSEAQGIYFTGNEKYAKSVEDLGQDYQKVEGVILRAVKVDEESYVFTASHPGCVSGPATWDSTVDR